MSVQNPLSRATAPDAEEYHKWRDEFLRSRPGRAAIKELGDLKKYHPDEHDKLLDQVLGECFKASRWAKGTDPFEHRRRSEGAARRKLPRQIEAVQELRRFIKDHPSIANQAIGNGILETGIHVLPDSSTPVEKLLDDALRAYEAGLASPALRSVDMCRYGAVVFPEQLGSKNTARPEAETMLLFELTRMFRAFTRRGAYLWFMRGGADIASGEPHYRIAWHFCTAAIKGEVPAPSDLANSCRRVKDRASVPEAQPRNPLHGLGAAPIRTGSLIGRLPEPLTRACESTRQRGMLCGRSVTGGRTCRTWSSCRANT